MTATASTRATGTSTQRSRWSVARTAGAGLGAVYLLVGTVGAVLTGITDWSMGNSATLVFFQVNPVHNVAHLGLGAALLVGALMGEESARSIDRLVGVVFALLSLVGPFVMGSHMDPLSLNSPDHALHLGTAAVLLVSAWVSRERGERSVV